MYNAPARILRLRTQRVVSRSRKLLDSLSNAKLLEVGDSGCRESACVSMCSHSIMDLSLSICPPSTLCCSIAKRRGNREGGLAVRLHHITCWLDHNARRISKYIIFASAMNWMEWKQPHVLATELGDGPCDASEPFPVLSIIRWCRDEDSELIQMSITGTTSTAAPEYVTYVFSESPTMYPLPEQSHRQYSFSATHLRRKVVVYSSDPRFLRDLNRT